MTKYYFDYDLLVSPFWNVRKAIKVTNNYLIRFVDSDVMYDIKHLLDHLENWCFTNDPLTFQTILLVLDDDIYLLENKYK